MKLSLSTNHAAHLLMQDEHAAWSRAGAFALCDYLEELEDDIGEEVDFCPVSLRCEYSQYRDLEEWANEQFPSNVDALFELCLSLNHDGRIAESPDEVDQAIREYIRDRGTLLEFSGGIIVSSF